MNNFNLQPRFVIVLTVVVQLFIVIAVAVVAVSKLVVVGIVTFVLESSLPIVSTKRPAELLIVVAVVVVVSSPMEQLVLV